MVLADEEIEHASPYWYARVIGLFHGEFACRGDNNPAKHLDCLFVRWMKRDTDDGLGFRTMRYPKISFWEGQNTVEAFGFIDPSQVIRSVHLIPCFHLGRTKELLPPSMARQPKEEDEDWLAFYVNMYVNALLSITLIHLISC